MIYCWRILCENYGQLRSLCAPRASMTPIAFQVLIRCSPEDFLYRKPQKFPNVRTNHLLLFQTLSQQLITVPHLPKFDVNKDYGNPAQ